MTRVHPRLNEWVEELLSKDKAKLVDGCLVLEDSWKDGLDIGLDLASNLESDYTPEGMKLNPGWEDADVRPYPLYWGRPFKLGRGDE